MRKYLSIAFIMMLSYAGASAQNGSIMVDTLTRNYLLHLPTLYTPSETYPLVINMHGAGSNGAQQELYSLFSSVANLNDFIIVYPEGIYNIWNAGFDIASDSLFDDVEFISQLIDSLSAEYPIDLNRVYACGMSMGGFMSYRLACELDNKIAAIASVTGSMTDFLINDCNPSRNVPILEIHGTLDSTVLYNGDTGLAAIPDIIQFWAVQHNCPSNPVVENLPDNVNEGSNIIRHTYSPCDLSSEVILYEVVNGGHTWPGAFFNITSAGITNRDIKAQEVIWEFFTRHTLDNPPTQLAEIQRQQRTFSVHPNPAAQWINVSADDGVTGDVQVIDLLGNVCLTKSFRFQNNDHHLSLESLPPGMYSIVLRAGEDIAFQKLIISR